jgi:hypothetical protein
MPLRSLELEFYNNLWGLGTEQEYDCRTGPPGNIGRRNPWARHKLKSTVSGIDSQPVRQPYWLNTEPVFCVAVYRRRGCLFWPSELLKAVRVHVKAARMVL